MAAPRHRTLIEQPEYAAQLDFLAGIYSVAAIELTLLGLLWGITTNAEEYNRVTWNIREAKSRSFGAIPPLVIFFQIKDDNEVLLLWIDEASRADEISQRLK